MYHLPEEQNGWRNTNRAKKHQRVIAECIYCNTIKTFKISSWVNQKINRCTCRVVAEKEARLQRKLEKEKTDLIPKEKVIREPNNKKETAVKSKTKLDYRLVVGNRIGNWTVLSVDENNNITIQCECGYIRSTYYSKINKNSKSCKSCAVKKQNKRIDMTGERIGRLTVISLSHSENKISYWNCKCDCGNETCVSRPNLLSCTTSCGCARVDRMSGPDNPMWVEDYSPAPSRRPDSVKKWRKDILLKFPCCQICTISKDLRVHHIFNYINNIELRECEFNGVTLCNKHHVWFHKIYGLKNNTLDQLEEFLGMPFKYRQELLYTMSL